MPPVTGATARAIKNMLMSWLLIEPMSAADIDAAFVRWFPHVDPAQLRWSDALRIPVQLLWLVLVLVLVRTEPGPALFPRITPLWRRARGWLGAVVRRTFTLCRPLLAYLARPVLAQWIADLPLRRSWERLRPILLGMSALWAMLALGAPEATPGRAQLAAALSICAALLWSMPGRVARSMLVGLACIVSVRYFWWRACTTLAAGSAQELLFGELLLLAELSLWCEALWRCFHAGGPDLAARAVWVRIVGTVRRYVFLAAPLAWLLLGLRVIDADVVSLALYGVPHLALLVLVGQRAVGAQVADMFVLLPWRRSVAAMVLTGFCVSGVIVGAAQLVLEWGATRPLTLFYLAWCGGNMLFLGGACVSRARVGALWRALWGALTSLLPRMPTHAGWATDRDDKGIRCC